MTWSIYYSDGSVVIGETEDEWRAAPDHDVQVVVLHEPPVIRRWTGVTDRQLWTGDDEYDPFGWGKKFGSWMMREEYDRIWEVAAYGRC